VRAFHFLFFVLLRVNGEIKSRFAAGIAATNGDQTEASSSSEIQ
jgi:hypothetical protein